MAATSAPVRPTARHHLERARPEHLGALLDLYCQFEHDVHGHTVGSGEQQACADRLFGTLRRGADPIWVALVGKKVIGFLWLQLCPQTLGPYAGRTVAHAPYLFVRADQRGRRIGHDFMAVAKGFARDHEFLLAFDAPPSDAAKWERRGFTPQIVTLMERADG